jgi:hypothetical protein
MPLDANQPQPSLPGFCPIEAAVAAMAAAGIEERGAVFTRREVVEFILDLVGYTADQPLHQARILEPAVGQGDFLLPTIDRLLDAYVRVPEADRRDVVADLGECLHAVELHRSSFTRTRQLAIDALRGGGGLAPAKPRSSPIAGCIRATFCWPLLRGPSRTSSAIRPMSGRSASRMR